MRQFKFRAWDKTDKKWVPDFTFGIAIDSRGVSKSGDLLFNGLYSYPEGHDIEVMQFTGLHDKNGKEIYEGDIICWKGYSSNGEKCRKCGHKESGDTVMKVWIEDGHVVHTADYCDSGFSDLHSTDSYYIEIIGNLYENPELIK